MALIHMFGKKTSPTIFAAPEIDDPPPPPESPPADTTAADLEAAKEEERQRQLKKKGRASTLLTGPLGLGAPAQTQKKTLLGQ